MSMNNVIPGWLIRELADQKNQDNPLVAEMIERSSLQQLSEAVNNVGPAPAVHRNALVKLNEEWPVLVSGICAVLLAHDKPVPREWQ